MVRFKLMINFICSLLWLTSCVPRRRKSETIAAFHRTGVAIAVDNLIQKYEREHIQFYKEEIGKGDSLEWPYLNNKNQSDYCKKYLQQSIPSRNTSDANGVTIRKQLNYEKLNIHTTHKVVMLQCTVVIKHHQVSYYITRAAKINCVYSVKSKGKWSDIIFTIMNKYCDFENKQLLDKSLRRKRVEIVHNMHIRTGQPIAKDEYLLEYELEHQKLLEIEGNNGEQIEWPHAMIHPDLNSYCYQYIKECVPNRNHKGATGKWNIGILHYQKLYTSLGIRVTTVTCYTSELCKRNYHITRALETNCVYALLQKTSGPQSPLVIIFKHCDFEFKNHKQTISQGYNNFDDDVIIKTELKEETFNTLEPFQFFPKD